MIIIYTADVVRGTTNPQLDMGSFKFNITEAFLSELDHEKIWQSVSEKVNAEIDISQEEMMQLIVYPLTFKEVVYKQASVRSVIKLVKKITDEKKKVFILKSLIVFTDKIIRDEDAKEIKEVLMMTKVERLIYEDAETEVSTRIARNLIYDGNSVESVSKNTGLSLSVVEKIAEDIAKEIEQN